MRPEKWKEVITELQRVGLEFSDFVNDNLMSPTDNSQPNNKPKLPPVPWWTPECQDAVARRRECLRKYRKATTYPNFLELKKAEVMARRTLKKAKRQRWKEFCSSLDHFSSVSAPKTTSSIPSKNFSGNVQNKGSKSF